ncbi:hypothetical protein JCM10908_006138 [Rhodotorula pacifica]|uniref:uncharacterized protein n=1 Tax=Rhodotorula pacifica TaxID=1495444 RepID=UPI00317304F7
MATETASMSSDEVAETSPAAPTHNGLASSPSRPSRVPAAAAPTSPSSASTSYTLPSTKPAPVHKRTYGGRRRAEPETEKAPTVEPTSTPPPPPPPSRLPLGATTSIVIPETDPSHGLTSEPTYAPSPEKQPTISRRTFAPSSSSQTHTTQHTTDPTSEEDGSNKSQRPARDTVASLLDSDGSESEEQGDEEGGEIDAFLAKRITLADLDAAVDAMLPTATPAAAARVQALATASSSLPPLTPSTEDASPAAHLSSDPTPVRTSLQPEVSRDTARQVTIESFKSQPARRRRAVIDSEDEEEDDDTDKDAAPRGTAIPLSQDSQDQLPTPEPTAAPPISKKEKLKQLAEKARQKQLESERRGKSGSRLAAEADEEAQTPASGNEEEGEEEMDEVDAIMDEASAEKKGRNGLITKKRKSKGLTKKEQAEMEKMAAAHARKVEVHLAATSRNAISMSEVFKKSLHSLPPAPVRHIGRASTPQAARATIDLINTSSSDSIENCDNDRSSPPAYVLKNVKASSKRTPYSDDIDFDVDQTPVPARRAGVSLQPDLGLIKRDAAKKAATPVAAPAPAPVEEEEDGLEEYDLGAALARKTREEQEKARKEQEERERQEKKRQLDAKKQAALKATRTRPSRAAEDSESDLEIEGAPRPSKGKRRAGRSQSPSDEADTLARYARTKTPSRKPALDELRRMRGSSNHPLSDNAEISESQFHSAGQTFGDRLDPRMQYSTATTGKGKKRQPNAVTKEAVDELLFHKMREQSAATRQKKIQKHRREEQNRLNGPKELESVDVNAMVKEKNARAEEDEQMEEDADEDYVEDSHAEEKEYNSADFGSDSDDDDEQGSGSDVPVARGRPAVTADDDDLDLEDIDSEGELVLPKSSQNEDRFGGTFAAGANGSVHEEADDEEDSMPPPANGRRARKFASIADDEEAEEQPVDVSAAAAEKVATPKQSPKQTRVALGGLLGDVGGADDGGGFSQIFDSQFSPGGEDAVVGGFLRRDDEVFEPPAPTMFDVQPLISTAEREADAARLEKRGGFNDLAPATPREIAAPRQYINEKGLLTQTRPAANFDSPSDTPLRSQRQSYSTLDSQSQALEETQLATAQTPTQITQRASASQRPNALRRTAALSNLESVAEVATEFAAPSGQTRSRDAETQLEEIQIDGETQDGSQDARPTAAQPPAATPKDAFAMLQAGAAREAQPEPLRQKEKRRPNAFIDTEANLSDEEGERAFGGVSDDENEDDHDQELAELVDNTKEDEDVEAQQDEQAAELLRANLEKAHEEELARAQRVADGKERLKRKRYELDDEDFDDDYIGTSNRKERKHELASSVADLKSNEETRDFAETLEKATVPETLEIDWLNQGAAESADEDEVMDDAPSDVFGSKPARINPHDVRAQVVELQRERERAVEMFEEDADSLLEQHLHIPVPGFSDSSPSRPIEINDRLATVPAASKTSARLDLAASLDSQSLYFSKDAAVQYSALGGEESQSISGAVTSSRSAITSFGRIDKSKPATVAGGTSAKTRSKGAPLAAKPSRLGNWRKGGDA